MSKVAKNEQLPFAMTPEQVERLGEWLKSKLRKEYKRGYDTGYHSGYRGKKYIVRQNRGVNHPLYKTITAPKGDIR